jgi:hypothetical protein
MVMSLIKKNISFAKLTIFFERSKSYRLNSQILQIKKKKTVSKYFSNKKKQLFYYEAYQLYVYTQNTFLFLVFPIKSIYI